MAFVQGHPTPAEQASLARRAQAGDIEARNEMVERNLGLIYRVVARLPDTLELPREDAEQMGVFGLIRAIEKFDPERSAFGTYATQWIRQAIQRERDNVGRSVRIPSHRHVEHRRMLRIEGEFRAEHDRDPTSVELAARFGAPRHLVERLRLDALDPKSLDAPVGDHGFALGDVLPDVAPSVHDAVINAERTSRVTAAVDRLPDPQRALIRRRYGFDGEPQTVVASAAASGISADAAHRQLSLARAALAVELVDLATPTN